MRLSIMSLYPFNDAKLAKLIRTDKNRIIFMPLPDGKDYGLLVFRAVMVKLQHLSWYPKTAGAIAEKQLAPADNPATFLNMFKNFHPGIDKEITATHIKLDTGEKYGGEGLCTVYRESFSKDKPISEVPPSKLWLFPDKQLDIFYGSTFFTHDDRGPAYHLFSDEPDGLILPMNPKSQVELIRVFKNAIFYEAPNE